MAVIWSGRCTFCSLEQPSNKEDPTLSTVSGIYTSVKLVSLKANQSKLLMEGVISIPFKVLTLSNAPAKTDVTGNPSTVSGIL